MRRKLFAGIAVPETKIEPLVQAVSKLKRTANEREYRMQWVPKKNWHITLWYYGPSTADEQTKLSESLSKLVNETSSIDLDVRGFGAFPEPTNARILWAGVSRTRELIDLYEKGAESHNFYEPHLTLARFRSLQSATALIEPFARKTFFSFKANEIVLYESLIVDHYPQYEPLVRFPFKSKS